MGRRAQTRSEERANTLSHLAGVLASVVLFFWFWNFYGKTDFIKEGVLVFSLSLIFLYSISTLYHAIPPGKGKEVFHILDHSGIFILIAGTYTPFLMGIFDGQFRFWIMIILWGLALGGVIFKFSGGVHKHRLSLTLYILMGWIAVFMAKPLWLAMYPDSIWWLLGGGVFYTGGILFYIWEKQPFNHFMWHIAVLGGSICHVVAVVKFV